VLQSSVSRLSQGKDGDKMNKNITLMSSCLLLISTHIFADRPAMEDNPPAAEPAAAAEIQDVVIHEPVSAVEMSMQHESASTTQYTTEEALELQPGETLPIKVLDFPVRGMTMETVQNQLGEPSEVSDTVGVPPITSWTYADRTVYFEHSNVIHAVANR